MPMSRVATLAVVLVAACASASDPEPTGSAVASIGGSSCNPRVCGGLNPQMLDCVYFSRLSSIGQANDHDVAIVSVRRADNTPMRLVAELDRLRGVHPTTGVVLAEHKDLVGTVIQLVQAGAPAQIVIDQVHAAGAHFWVGAKSAIETYDLSYTVPGSGAPPKTLLGALVFAGDTYDPITKQVTIGPATKGWINIVCPDGVLARMHQIGHTTAAGQRLAITTTLAKRQSVLNAMTMNACGNGVSFHAPGEPLTLSESQLLQLPSSPLQEPPVTVEAIWGPEGAVCLGVPRNANTAAAVAAMVNAIAAECGAPLPSCSSMLLNWTSHGSALTGNPAGSSP